MVAEQATITVQRRYTHLADTSFSWTGFSNETVANASNLSELFGKKLAGYAAVTAVVVALYFVLKTKPARE